MLSCWGICFLIQSESTSRTSEHPAPENPAVLLASSSLEHWSQTKIRVWTHDSTGRCHSLFISTMFKHRGAYTWRHHSASSVTRPSPPAHRPRPDRGIVSAGMSRSHFVLACWSSSAVPMGQSCPIGRGLWGGRTFRGHQSSRASIPYKVAHTFILQFEVGPWPRRVGRHLQQGPR